MILVYAYNKEGGEFLFEDIGSYQGVMDGLKSNEDFTLTKPPNYSQPWYWYDNAWQSEPKPTP